jgi:hypothetical protein
MQGQENRKNDILGLESSLSAEAADLLLTEDANMVRLCVKESVENIIPLSNNSYYRDSLSRSWL